MWTQHFVDDVMKVRMILDMEEGREELGRSSLIFYMNT